MLIKFQIHFQLNESDGSYRMSLAILNDTQIFQPARGYLTYLVLGQPIAAPVSFFIYCEICVVDFQNHNFLDCYDCKCTVHSLRKPVGNIAYK